MLRYSWITRGCVTSSAPCEGMLQRLWGVRRVCRLKRWHVFGLMGAAMYLTVVLMANESLQRMQQQFQERQHERQLWQLQRQQLMQQQAIPSVPDVFENVKVHPMRDTLRSMVKQRLEEASGRDPIATAGPFNALRLPRYQRNSSLTQCSGPDVQEEFRFMAITKKMLLFSAFVDYRVTDFEEMSPNGVVRLIMVMQRNANKTLFCRFRDGRGWESDIVRVEHVYETAENHNRLFGTYIVSCPVPSSFSLPPCAIWVSATDGVDDKGVSVRVNPSRRAHRHNFTVCVPALFGHIDKMHIVEFVELSRLLGADHFVFYDYAASTTVRSLLAYYQSNGVVTVVPWPLGSHIGPLDIWNYGQTAAIHDCLFRTMGVSTFAIFEDFDEYLVPVHHATWGRLTANLSSDVIGYVFESVFFDPRLQGGGAVVGGDTIGLRSVRHTLRSYHTSTVRTKCMVRPEYIFEQGIHHVSKPVRAVLHVSRVSPDIAVIHHHRTCDSLYGMQCKPIVQDRTAARYADKLQHAVAKLLKAFHVL